MDQFGPPTHRLTINTSSICLARGQQIKDFRANLIYTAIFYGESCHVKPDCHVKQVGERQVAWD